MDTVKTKLNVSIFNTTEEVLSRLIDELSVYIENYKMGIEVISNYDKYVNELTEDGVIEKLQSIATLKPPVILDDALSTNLLIGSVIDVKGRDMEEVLQDLADNELGTILCEIPLDEDELETILPKMKRIVGDASVIIFTLIDGFGIESNYLTTGRMILPMCLDMFLSRKGKYNEQTVLNMIQELQDNILSSGINFGVFEGNDDLEEEFYSSIKSDVAKNIISKEEYKLNIDLVKDLINNVIDEEYLVKYLTGSELSDLENEEDEESMMER